MSDTKKGIGEVFKKAKDAGKKGWDAAEKGADAIHDAENKAQAEGQENPDVLKALAKEGGREVGATAAEAATKAATKAATSAISGGGAGAVGTAGGAVAGGAATGVAGGAGVGVGGAAVGTVAPGAGNAAGGVGGAAGGGVGGAVGGGTGGGAAGGIATGGAGEVVSAAATYALTHGDQIAGGVDEALELDVEGKLEATTEHVGEAFSIKKQTGMTAEDVGKSIIQGNPNEIGENLKDAVEEKKETFMNEDRTLSEQMVGGAGAGLEEGLEEKLGDTQLGDMAKQGTQGIDTATQTVSAVGKVTMVDDVFGKAASAVGIEPGDLAQKMVKEEVMKGELAERVVGLDVGQAIQDLEKGQLPKVSFQASSVVKAMEFAEPAIGMVEKAAGVEIPGKKQLSSFLSEFKPSEVMQQTGIDLDVGAALTGGGPGGHEGNVTLEADKIIGKTKDVTESQKMSRKVGGGVGAGATGAVVGNAVDDTGLRDAEIGGVKVYDTANQALVTGADVVDVAGNFKDFTKGDATVADKVGSVGNLAGKAGSAVGGIGDKVGEFTNKDSQDDSDELGNTEKDAVAAQSKDGEQQKVEGDGVDTVGEQQVETKNETVEKEEGKEEQKAEQKEEKKESSFPIPTDLLNKAAEGLNVSGVTAEDNVKSSDQQGKTTTVKQASQGLQAAKLQDANEVSKQNVAMSEDAIEKATSKGASPAA